MSKEMAAWDHLYTATPPLKSAALLSEKVVVAVNNSSHSPRSTIGNFCPSADNHSKQSARQNARLGRTG